jgi:hypothetical protein
VSSGKRRAALLDSDDLDLVGDLAGEGAHADGRAGMAAGVDEDFDEEV